MATSASALLVPTERVGRYFSVVSGLTTLVALLIPVALLAAGAPGSRPKFSQMFDRVGDLGFAGLALTSIAVLALGLILHPLQYPLTQLLEGYWGTSSLAITAMTRSVRMHHRRRDKLIKRYVEAEKQVATINARLNQLRPILATNQMPGIRDRVARRVNELIEQRTPFRVERQETGRAIVQYPDRPELLMPTRLGNVLRRHERIAGEPYGIDAVDATTFLAQVAPDVVRDYHDDVRSSLDLSVRMTLVWACVAATGVVLLWPYDTWLFVPLVASCFAALSYRGAVAAAAQYGEALRVLVALGRSSLYEQLNVEFPENTEAELELNRKLGLHLKGISEPIEFRSTKKSAYTWIRPRD